MAAARPPSPGLSVAELHRIATDDHVAKLSAWRNTVFHVPRGRDPYRLELRFLETSLGDYYVGLVDAAFEDRSRRESGLSRPLRRAHS